MDKYIDKTPEALGEVLNSKKRIEQLLADVTVDKIMLTGSGTSYHSGVQMKHWMSQITGIPVESYYPFQLCDDLFLTQEKVLFIGISQDGGSYSTYHAMQVAKQNHCILGSLSAYEGILLDEMADFSFTLPIEAEKAGPKTMGYSATKLQLLIIASSLSGKAGVAEEIKQNLNSITGQYLSRRKYIPVPKERRKGNGNFIEVVGAKENNLKNINVKFPLGVFTVVTGVSGSGKSTLVNEILYKGLASKLYTIKGKPGKQKR